MSKQKERELLIRLRKFLNENNATERFVEMLKIDSMISIVACVKKNINNELNIILNAFEWEEDTESGGYNFWSGLNQKWRRSKYREAW